MEITTQKSKTLPAFRLLLSTARYFSKMHGWSRPQSLTVASVLLTQIFKLPCPKVKLRYKEKKRKWERKHRARLVPMSQCFQKRR